MNVERAEAAIHDLTSPARDKSTIPIVHLKVVWRLMRFWLAGNALCKIFAFLRAFGFYLSSMVLIVVSLDRYIAVIYPLRANSEFARRGHYMLVAAWIVSALCSVPQVKC